MNHQKLPKRPPKFKVGDILQRLDAGCTRMTVIDVYWSTNHYTYKALQGSKVITAVEKMLINNNYKVIGNAPLAKELELTKKDAGDDAIDAIRYMGDGKF